MAGPALPAGLVLIPPVIAVVAMILSKLSPSWSGGWWDVAWTNGAISALAGTLLARRAAGPAERDRWGSWAAAAGSWLAGQILWDVYGIAGFPQSPNAADVAWWGFAILVMVSLVRCGSRSRSVRRVAMLETAPLIGGAIALSVALLWHDAATSSLALAPKLSALAYPAVYIAATVLMLQAMVGGALRASRSVALPLVLGGMAAQAVAFSLWSAQLLARTYVPGGTLLDPLWVIGLATIGIGGLCAAHRPEPSVPSDEPGKHGAIVPGALFGLLTAALIRAQLAGSPSPVLIALGAGLLLSGAALVARGFLLERRLRDLLDRERRALSALAQREGELGRLNAQLVEDSRHDPLTGMRNRRALSDDLLQLEAARKERGGTYALALCDVDHFKAYNDRLGHLAGDQALREVAATVRGALRHDDVAYRFGGEELLLVLRDVRPAEALDAVERVRLAVEHAALPHPEGIDGVMTVSIGVAAGDEDHAGLMARADAALYDAKRAGRNRTVAAGEKTTQPVGLGRLHSAVDEPVPRHVRSMLTVSRAAASGRGPMPVLEALAETIRSELAFHVVSVNLVDRERSELTCVVVLGPEDARRQLLGRTAPYGEWETVLASEHQRCGAIWLPAGAHAWEDESVFWIPPAGATAGPDSWDPDDMLILPLRGQDGEVLGLVSVDQPVSGRRPEDSQIAYLMAVADHAGLAIEQSRRDWEQAAAAREQSAELRLAAVMLLAETLDLRDPSTARHARTVGTFAQRTAVALGVADEQVERIHAAGVLHDLGKLGIADAILHKPGPLDDAEWREMERHPEIGARILEHAGLRDIAGWVRAHHERIDGCGYPDRLRGDEIALEARILAVADAYEAMIADRPYRAGMPPADARAELERCAGSQFDPQVVRAFLGALDQAPEAPVQPGAPAVDAAVGLVGSAAPAVAGSAA